MSVPLPLTIIVKQMGADLADLWKIKAWTDAFFKRISMMLTEEEELDAVDREMKHNITSSQFSSDCGHRQMTPCYLNSLTVKSLNGVEHSTMRNYMPR